MDKGAHYFKCDFQVHTPRDINWSGSNCITPDERKVYSEKLIRACRTKGIDAIAITDHHDFVFFPYIKKASESELNDNGALVDQYERIIVFPALELTLASPPCQALLILDSAFPENMLPAVLTLLTIHPNADDESKTAHVQPIPKNVAHDFRELYERLNEPIYLRNRFTIFPHVSDGGHKTLLRQGFSDFYKSMPCVGGYTDGPAASLGKGNLFIVNGKNRDYGFKSIAVIQTSDNRKESHADLGSSCTWIKWAEPTAEALRQACLAKDSRISQSIPILPSMYITSIDVSNSKFLGQVYLELNSQYNAVIGGRGTGKSTILEYLRWGLCDQFPDITEEDEELPRYQEKRKRLIEKTLLPFDATVQVSFMKNNVLHIIRKKAKSNELLLKIGSGEFVLCNEGDVRNLLPIQAYSQKQLSSVGVSIDELKRLIYSPIRQTLSEHNSRYEKLNIEIRGCYEMRLQKRLIENVIEKNELELKSLLEQAERLRKEIKGISKEDEIIIGNREQYNICEQLVDGWAAEIESAKESVISLINEMNAFPTSIHDDLELPKDEQALVSGIYEEVSNIFTGVKHSLNSLKDKLDTDNKSLEKYSSLLNSWTVALIQQKQNYEAAKTKSSAQEVTLTQIQKVEERIKEIRKSLSEKKQLILKVGEPETKFDSLKEEWFMAHEKKGDLLESQCNQLGVLSDNNLKASLGRGKGTDGLEGVLKKLISGTNVRKDKVENLCIYVNKAEDSIKEWQKILVELEALAGLDAVSDQGGALPTTPILSRLNFTPNDLRKMAEKITLKNWIDLFLIQLDDVPLFQYKTREGEYIEFSDASAGQQATALIHVLLNQEGPPLIIDQPEDDLDNQMVSEIATLIWQAKKNRQLIFTSHNANIVVNGDGELIVCCDYKVSGDQSKGGIKIQGAIDVNDIRYEITRVMEGGEEAFKLRKEKYGF